MINWFDEVILPCWLSKPLVVNVSWFSAPIIPCWLFSTVCAAIVKLVDVETILPAWLLILFAFNKPLLTTRISPDWFWISETWSVAWFKTATCPFWLSSCLAFKVKSVTTIPWYLSESVLRLSKICNVVTPAVVARIDPCWLLRVLASRFSVPFCAEIRPFTLLRSDWWLLIVSLSPRLASTPFWFWIPCFTPTCAECCAINLLPWLLRACVVTFTWLPLISLCLFDLMESATKLRIFAVIKPAFWESILVFKLSCDWVRILPWLLTSDVVFTVLFFRERIFPLLLFREPVFRANKFCAIIPLSLWFSNNVSWLLIDWLLLLIVISFAKIRPWLFSIIPLLRLICWAATIFPFSVSRVWLLVSTFKGPCWLPIVPLVLSNLPPVVILPSNFEIIWLSLLLSSADVVIFRYSAKTTLWLIELNEFAVKFNPCAWREPFCWLKLSDNVISACLAERMLPWALVRFLAFKAKFSWE